MELRNHPRVSYKGVRSWPPAWFWIAGDTNKYPEGEVGILKELLKSFIQPSNRFFLVIEYGAALYLGSLLFDQPALCEEVYTLLKDYYGHTIEYIGGLDLRHKL